MVRYIFASHYRMADGLKETIEFLTSVKENIYTVSAYVTENYNIEEEIKKIFDDFSEEEDSFEVLTAPESFSIVREALEKEGIPMASAEVTMLPQTYVTLTEDADLTNIQRILDFLDEDDDVQEVFHNWDE